MAKNKDINITPSKGISIVIKNDIQQPPPIKPKKKRRYKKIDVLPKTPAPIMQQSAGDTSYIKAQPGRFSLWRDTTTATPVLTLAQATSQGFIPQMNQPTITAPQQPQPPALPAPPQQLALPAPPITVNFGDFMRGLAPQEYTPMRPDSRFQEPNMTFDDKIDFNDTFYQALPEDKKEAYKDARLEDIAKNIDETAEKAVEDIEKTDFYKTQLDAPTQAATKEKSKYLTIQQKLEGMKAGSIKGIATRDTNNLNEPKYPQNKIYRESYKKGLKTQEETIKKKITELDGLKAVGATTVARDKVGTVGRRRGFIRRHLFVPSGAITIGIGVPHHERIRDSESTGPSPASPPFSAGPARCFPRADHVPPRPPPPSGGGSDGERSRVPP